MKKTIGILAHVDAGKTTFCEQLLFQRKVIQKCGRVDHKDTFLDVHELEKKRGITIFSEQAFFSYENDQYYLLDTPGHVDFSSEMERAVSVLDYAVLIISALDGIKGHTKTVWNLLEKQNIPVFIFLNKMDCFQGEKEALIKQIQKELSENILDMPNETLAGGVGAKVKESLAMIEEESMEAYLEDKWTEAEWRDTLCRLVNARKLFPCICGSALKSDGVEHFFQLLHSTTKTNYEQKRKEPFKARIYKVKQEAGKRLTFMKALSGCIQVKQEIGTEKINQIGFLQGSKWVFANDAKAGDVFAITGLKEKMPGDGIGIPAISSAMEPVLQAGVVLPKYKNKKEAEEEWNELELEGSVSKSEWKEEWGGLQIRFMGMVQLEILKELVYLRYGYEVDFSEPRIIYKETIKAPVMGYGHFEPLRHYAEAVLELIPGERGSGITFESRCSCDKLSNNYQNLIRTHIFEKEHKGVLTGSALTDVKIILHMGIAHIKHTEGGDFREAVYRAVRQGLCKAESLLLEPYYNFRIECRQEHMGKILSDITKFSGEFQSPVIKEDKIKIEGRAPAIHLMNYAQELTQSTKGMGQISLLFDGYDLCHNTEEVILNCGYQMEHDIDNPSSSVFCSKGSSYTVPWQEAENYMHTVKVQKHSHTLGEGCNKK